MSGEHDEPLSPAEEACCSYMEERIARGREEPSPWTAFPDGYRAGELAERARIKRELLEAITGASDLLSDESSDDALALVAGALDRICPEPAEVQRCGSCGGRAYPASPTLDPARDCHGEGERAVNDRRLAGKGGFA